MKKILLSGLLFINTIISLHAQLYIPNGAVQSSGNNNVGIGTPTPNYKLDVLKSTATNENDIIANFIRYGGATGGSSIVRFGYHNTCDFEINSGYTTTGHRFGSYFDLNIANNYTGGVHGGVNFATNGTVKMAIRPNGNVGIGTENPSNDQGWGRVLDVAGLQHSKILATSVNSTFRTGIFSHNESWYGGGGFVGTESNHNLHLITGYSPKVTILTNGNVGVGTTNPTKLLDIQNSNSGAGESYIWIKKGIDASNVNREAGIILGTGAGDFGNTFKIAAMSSTGYFDTPKLNFKYTNPAGGGIIDLLTIDSFGKVGIGSINPDSKLTVKGKIHAEEVKVDLAVPADYVFEKYFLGESSLKPDYTLLTLSEVEKFTEANHHLPNVPSAKEIKENGLFLGEMSNVLLQKIEELTLYVIEQNKELKRQTEDFEKQNTLLKCQNEKILILEKKIENIEALTK